MASAESEKPAPEGRPQSNITHREGSTPRADAQAARLSLREEVVLQHLLDLWRRCPSDGPDAKEVWGVPWRVGGTRSFAASSSRTLRRLEDRGLVLRQNGASGSPDTQMARTSRAEAHNRTTGVVLLPAGLELAERLTKRGRPNVNRTTRARRPA